MKNLILNAVLFPMLLATSSATVFLSDDFDTYTSGNLVGQGGWLQTGATATNPIQFSGPTKAVLGTAGGQDAYDGFSSTATATAGTSLYTVFSWTSVGFPSPTATGDYFLHLSDPAGTTSNFFQCVFARSSGFGIQLGLADTPETGSTVTWGTSALNLFQTIEVVVAWNFVAGATNDTFTMYVDGNTYLTHTWTSVSSEPTQLAAANLRQGASGLTPQLYLLSLEVTNVNPVPEPSVAVLGLLAVCGVFLSRRKR